MRVNMLIIQSLGSVLQIYHNLFIGYANVKKATILHSMHKQRVEQKHTWTRQKKYPLAPPPSSTLQR